MHVKIERNTNAICEQSLRMPSIAEEKSEMKLEV